jgi:hypothetical protein
MTPMGRILADLLSIFSVWRMDEESPFIRVIRVLFLKTE